MIFRSFTLSCRVQWMLNRLNQLVQAFCWQREQSSGRNNLLRKERVHPKKHARRLPWVHLAAFAAAAHASSAAIPRRAGLTGTRGNWVTLNSPCGWQRVLWELSFRKPKSPQPLPERTVTCMALHVLGIWPKARESKNTNCICKTVLFQPPWGKIYLSLKYWSQWITTSAAVSVWSSPLLQIYWSLSKHLAPHYW